MHTNGKVQLINIQEHLYTVFNSAQNKVWVSGELSRVFPRSHMRIILARLTILVRAGYRIWISGTSPPGHRSHRVDAPEQATSPFSRPRSTSNLVKSLMRCIGSGDNHNATLQDQEHDTKR
jgi:hypothetical protein